MTRPPMPAMPAAVRTGLAAGLLLLAGLAPAGCAGAPAGPEGNTGGGSAAAGADAPGVTGRQLMVTLPPLPPPLVAQRAGEIAFAYRLRTVFAWPLASLGEPCIVYEVLGGRSPEMVARRLATDPRVRSVQPIQVFETLTSDGGGDPYSHLQHGAEELRLAGAHRMATGRGVRVAVVDTGVDLDHPDLRGRIARTGNFVDRGEQTFTSDIHGTAVAGVIAAGAGNSVGIVGVAPQAEILAFKACWPRSPGTRQALCNSYTLAKALDTAIAARAQVMNLSLGGPADPLLARLVRSALERGIAVVAADGSRERPGGGRGFPASVEGVIAVEGSGPGGSPTVPGARAAPRALAAPGVDILTTVPRGSYDFFTGSSLAAAQVAGVAALLLEKNPRLTPMGIKETIERSARPLTPEAGAPAGARMVDACAAVALAAGEGGCGP